MELEACWYEDAEWRGWVLTDSRTVLLHLHVFTTYVAGLTHYSEAQDSSFGPGSRLLLKPEPLNPVDTDAVAVWNADGTLQAGHIPAFIAHDLPRAPHGRRGLAISEQTDSGLRIAIGILVSRDVVTFRSAPDCDTQAGRIATEVAKVKADTERTMRWSK